MGPGIFIRIAIYKLCDCSTDVCLSGYYGCIIVRRDVYRHCVAECTSFVTIVNLEGEVGVWAAVFIARWFEAKPACINHRLCEVSASRYTLPVRPVIGKSQHTISR